MQQPQTPKAVNGELAAYLPCDDNWLCQWVLPTNLMIPGREYKFSVELRAEQGFKSGCGSQHWRL